MTREELLKMAKPILFNTEMVSAIQKKQKRATRRIMKPEHFMGLGKLSPTEFLKTIGYRYEMTDKELIWANYKPKYQVGDILYIRETWAEWTGGYLYRAWPDGLEQPGKFPLTTWKPSIHMPKEAARIFLKVTNVKAERLQDITEEQALMEGVPGDTDYPINKVYCPRCHGVGLIGAVHEGSLGYIEVDCPECNAAVKRFENLWNSTVDKKVIDLYGWNANPWIWVYEFEEILAE